MTDENDRLREFISSPIDSERFLHDAQQLKDRLNNFQSSHPLDDHQLTPLLDLVKSLGDYRQVEVNPPDVPSTTTTDDPGTSNNWRTRRKKTPLDATVVKNLRSYPASIEYPLSRI